MARSRAGMLLGLLAMLLSVALPQSSGAGTLRRQGMVFVAIAGLVGGMLIWTFGLAGLSDRFDTSPLDDYRFDILPIAVQTAQTFQPFGSGFGTFGSVYLFNEDVNVLSQDKIDHAHNDWIELWVEGGWFAMIILLAFLIWFASATRRAWIVNNSPASYVDRTLPRAAAISVGMLLLHSLVDYPLRTTGLVTLFAFNCAMLIPRPPTNAALRGSPEPSR
jgi:O-antigen ligase